MEIKRGKGIVYVQARGEQFEVIKDDNEWLMIHPETQRYVTGHPKTQKSCLEAGEKEINKLSDDEFKGIIEYARKSIKNKKYWLNPHIQNFFKRHFDMELNNFLDGTIFAFTGNYIFDVIKFDKIMRPPEGTSTHDWITQEKGKAVARLIHKLIGA